MTEVMMEAGSSSGAGDVVGGAEIAVGTADGVVVVGPHGPGGDRRRLADRTTSLAVTALHRAADHTWVLGARRDLHRVDDAGAALVDYPYMDDLPVFRRPVENPAPPRRIALDPVTAPRPGLMAGRLTRHPDPAPARWGQMARRDAQRFRARDLSLARGPRLGRG